MLSEAQIDRYARHILLQEVGGVGQEKLLASHVHVEGLSAPGQWLVSWLSLAGVGRITLEDQAPVTQAEVAPLLRQADVGRPRAEALARALPTFNPDVQVAAGDGAGADLVVRLGPPAGGGGLHLVVAGEQVAVLPAGCPVCAACLAQLPAEAPSPRAAALAGSMGGAEALIELLGKGPRPRAAAHFDRGEPRRCTHGG